MSFLRNLGSAPTFVDRDTHKFKISTYLISLLLNTKLLVNHSVRDYIWNPFSCILTSNIFYLILRNDPYLQLANIVFNTTDIISCNPLTVLRI
jgi:hypothetical protein